MWTALIIKELRECGLYAGLALLAVVHYLGEGMDLPLVPGFSYGRQNEIPFIAEGRENTVVVIAMVAAAVLGLHQTVWESWRQTTLFLLHRPVPREWLFYGKLITGAALLVAITAIPLLAYCLWAVTPGTHASPFFWGMTESWWRTVPMALVCYLGAFLAGLRPARWLGSRTWPLLTAVLTVVALKYVPVWAPVFYLGSIALSVLLLLSILHTARMREYP
jgi:hypothetical protein